MGPAATADEAGNAAAINANAVKARKLVMLPIHPNTHA
jgi:hypothetical protein